MNEKTRISRNKLHACGWFSLGFFVVPIVIFSQVIDSFYDNLRLYFLISLGLGVLAGIAAVLIAREQYITIVEDGFVITKGKKEIKHPFSDFAGSKVVKHYYYGIYTGTTREISVKTTDGSSEKINANRLKKEAFAELVSYLSKSEFMESHNTEVVADYFNQERFFSIDKNSIIKANKIKMIIWIVVSVVTFLVALASLIIYFAVSDSPFAMALLIMAGFGIIVLAFLELVPSIINYKKIQTIPDHISMDDMTLAVGSDSFKVSDIESISMVPDTYQILTRDLIIVTNGGHKHKYNFGKANKSPKQTFKDYADLYKTIKLWCITQKINFTSILG